MLQVRLHDARGIDRGEAGSIEAHLECHEVTVMPADGHAIRERRLHWLRPPFLGPGCCIRCSGTISLEPGSLHILDAPSD